MKKNMIRKKVFATVPESSINSWDSWYIFNMRKINSCYYVVTTQTWKKDDSVGHRKNVCGKCTDVALWNNIDTRLDNVHTWTSAFLRHITRMSFMVPVWPYTEPGPAPILVSKHLEAMLVQRMLFIALVTAAQISPNVFLPPGWLLTNVQVNFTLQHTIHAHIHTIYTMHGIYFHTSHSCMPFKLSLLGRLAALGSWCLIQ